MTDGKGPDEIDDDEGAGFDDEEAAEANAPTDADAPTEDTEPLDAADTEEWEPDPTPESSAAPGITASERAEERQGIARDLASRTAATDELPYVDDRFSRYWVGAIVATFGVILLYALLFGKAGFFTPPAPTESPAPIVTPGASPSPSPTHTFIPPTPERSASPALSPSPAVSPSLEPSPSPGVTPHGPSPTPAPTLSPNAGST